MLVLGGAEMCYLEKQGPGRTPWPPRAPGNAELCDENFTAYCLKISEMNSVIISILWTWASS